MKTELVPTSSDLSLLPRADLPVIWDGFRAKVQELHQTAETLTVTTIEQKAEMELARTTRLTLKQIRVEVEKKRVELGEGHLTEIQKINGAAKKLKELIEPLEARLLHQEQFAERVEADRVLELTKHRNDEVRLLRPGIHIPVDIGKMSDLDYDLFVARLRAEAAEIAEARRRQVEAEAALAAELSEARRRQAEMQAAFAAQLAEEQKLREEQAAALAAQQAEARAAAAEAEIKVAAERAELQRRYEAARILAQQERDAENWKAQQEQAEKDRQRDEELKTVQAKADAQLAEARAEADRQQAENERIQAELEVQLANERAAKLAEERRLHALAVAPDKEQLKAFHNSIYQVPQPDLKTPEGVAILNRVQCKIAEAFLIIDVFCAE